MAGSDADTEHDPAGETPSDDASSVPPETLAKFLTPVPSARSSAPPARVGRPPAPLAGLFAEPPIPRKNASSLPPPVTAPSSHSTRPLPSRPPIDLDALRLMDDSRVAGVTRESERVELDDDDEDLELTSIPPPLFKSWPSRLTALAAGICLGLLGVQMFAVRSSKRPDRPPAAAVVATGDTPPASASADVEEDKSSVVASDQQPIDTDQPIDEATARDLRLQARRLLEAGFAQQGVAMAQRAIGADPNDPESYVLLAAGLQDLGRWEESREVFAKCVRESDRKANTECVYFATGSK